MWYFSTLREPNDVFTCQDGDYDAFSIDTDDFEPCVNLTSGHDLVEGSFPKRCQNSDDCELENGTYAACQCGMDGLFNCLPDISSSVYDEYWSE